MDVLFEDRTSFDRKFMLLWILNFQISVLDVQVSYDKWHNRQQRENNCFFRDALEQYISGTERAPTFFRGVPVNHLECRFYIYAGTKRTRKQKSVQ